MEALMATGNSGPREVIKPHEGDARYQRRKPDGTFGEGDKVSRAQPDDKAHRSKTEPPRNQGDKGDYQKAKKK
jgi:hypothetical protein